MEKTEELLQNGGRQKMASLQYRDEHVFKQLQAGTPKRGERCAKGSTGAKGESAVPAERPLYAWESHMAIDPAVSQRFSAVSAVTPLYK